MSHTPSPLPAQAPAQQTGGPAFRYTAALADRIETRWQQVWDEAQTYRQPNPGEPGFDPARPKYFVMDMFPYPSGAGLHVGHPEGYTATDIIARYKRMRGFNVLHPMGWDAFGLPAEQYAIQTGIHPAITTKKSIDNFRRQLKRFGFCYDWSREFGTIDPEYYKWTQWIFLQIYNAWYDPEAGTPEGEGERPMGRARPIRELIEEFESGRREPRVNPDAAEHPAEAKARTFGPWSTLSEADRRLIVDSYRLAYIGEQTVNWCPKLGTALANEEVIDGKSERGSFPVYRKPLRQWMFRITAYADRLLADLPRLDWPESTRTQQAEWIGRSEGAEVEFPIVFEGGTEPKLEGQNALRVFTTRPDTIFGATFMAVAPEHPLVEMVLRVFGPDSKIGAPVRSYVDQARNRSDVERQESKEKTGVALPGVWCVNPATGERIPVWVADYVLMGYGFGAIMAVPAHDDRDHEFAEKFGIAVREVVRPADGSTPKGCFSGDGVAVNSANAEVSLDGLPTADAKRRIVDWLAAKGMGRRRVNYKLRDWLFSRQRYWGEPFPIVFDEQGFHHPLREDALPLTLPEMADYQPIESEDPQPLLAKAADWLHTTAGEAGVEGLPPDAKVTREANTMPGWAGSCWYYLRYTDPRNAERFAGRGPERYWMLTPEPGVDARRADEHGTYQPHLHRPGGVDLYVGGAEHAVLHLLYARFWHKVLFDLGEVSTPEPFQKLFHQGLITSYAYRAPDGSLVPIDEVEERDGAYLRTADGVQVEQITAKMSKSLKNVVNPGDVIAEFGADTFRLYEMYMGPLAASTPWNTKDTVGLFRFLQRAWRMAVDENTGELTLAGAPDEAIERQLHKTIKKVGEDIEHLSFNTAIAAMFEFVNAAARAENQPGRLTHDQLDRFARVLAPFAPHMGEELWAKLGHAPSEGDSIALAPWPGYDEAMLVESEIEIPVQILGKVRSKIRVAPDASAEQLEAAALADERVKELLAGKTVRKVVAVPGRMVNIVAN